MLPIVAIALMIGIAAFMFHFSPIAWFFVVGWIGSGFVIYYTYARRREREKRATPVVLREPDTTSRAPAEYLWAGCAVRGITPRSEFALVHTRDGFTSASGGIPIPATTTSPATPRSCASVAASRPQ